MPRIDPFSLPRPKRPTQTRSFSKDGEPAITLTLRRLSYPEDVAAQEDARALIETYITGGELRGAAPFPDPDVIPSETLFLTAARLSRMQCAEDPEEIYPPIEQCVLSARRPNDFREIVAWANGIGWRDGGEDEQGQGE